MLLKKMINLRPQKCIDNFIIGNCNGKLIKQLMEKKMIDDLLQKIAVWLNHLNQNGYISHSFRRTSATVFIDTRADVTSLKQVCSWKSNSVVNFYIDQSITNMHYTSNQIFGSVKPS